MEKLGKFLFRKRENKFLDGIVNNPVFLFYDLIGNEKEVAARREMGLDNRSSVRYLTGETFSVPLSGPLFLMVLSKRVCEYFYKKNYSDLYYESFE